MTVVDPIIGAGGVTAAPTVAGAAVERRQAADLAEILERVLNTGIVIAGEIRVDLLDIELLTIKIRLIVTSIDRAEEIGLDWWKGDAWYSANADRDRSAAELARSSGENQLEQADDSTDSASSKRTRSKGTTSEKRSRADG